MGWGAAGREWLRLLSRGIAKVGFFLLRLLSLSCGENLRGNLRGGFISSPGVTFQGHGLH